MRMERARAHREDSAQNIKGILANTSLLRALDERQLEKLTAVAEPMRPTANTCILRQGDAACGLFVVVYGQVRVGFERKDGNEKTLAILGQNKCFGLVEMLIDHPHLAFVKTTTDSMLLHLDAATVLSVARENFDFAHELMMRVSRQMYALTGDIESYSLLTARQRLANYLLRQSRYQAGQLVELIASKTLIASRLSLTPETLSRLLNEFSSDGMISVTGRRIRILDQERIGAMVAA